VIVVGRWTEVGISWQLTDIVRTGFRHIIFLDVVTSVLEIINTPSSGSTEKSCSYTLDVRGGSSRGSLRVAARPSLRSRGIDGSALTRTSSPARHPATCEFCVTLKMGPMT
jgi:hypothetical protein